jgi:hypothetical protein
MKKKNTKNYHPFYCMVKGCRKSAWETPEHMAATDWKLAEQVVKCKTVEAFLELLDSDEKKESFYWRIIGWPEGKGYMHNWQDRTYAERTGWPCIVKHEIPKIMQALQKYKDPTE